MNQPPSFHNPEFDDFAENYDESLRKGLAVSGESKEFFAQGRIDWLKRNLESLNFEPARAIDFGCGTGTATPYLMSIPGASSLLGLEVSPKSLDVARRLHGSEHTRFSLVDEHSPNADADLAFCNGVFHHIPPANRAEAAEYVFRCLRPGGLFTFWENNPWNPGTRYIMSRIPFDRSAITLSPPESVALLRRAGFTIVRRDFLFFFPRVLRWLRTMEPALSKVPFGAQYHVLAQRPA